MQFYRLLQPSASALLPLVLRPSSPLNSLGFICYAIPSPLLPYQNSCLICFLLILLAATMVPQETHRLFGVIWSPPRFQGLGFFFLFAVLGLELRAFTLSHSTSLIFEDHFFWDRVSWTICQGWLRTMILLISATWVARITGVSHWHPAQGLVLSLTYSTISLVSPEVVSGVDVYPTNIVLIINQDVSLFTGGTGFELRALNLLGRHSTTWATLPALFSFSYILGIVVFCIFAWGWLQMAILLWLPT
jgi:hypothetical protein